MVVQITTDEDIPAWLKLAREVEPLFGPMAGEPSFHKALERNIARESALCVRAADGPPGAPLLGGMLFSAHPPKYEVGWLAVTEGARRGGIAKAFVENIVSLVEPPAEVTVKTFREENVGGRAARRFYESMGFLPAELDTGPDGIPVQVFRLRLY